MYKNNLPFSSYDSIAGIKNKFFTKWLKHPDFDDYWQGILPNKKDYQELDIPVLTTTGYYDGDQNGALFYYRNHDNYNPKNKHYIIIGPFDHAGAQWMPSTTPAGGGIIEKEAQIPLYKLVIQWFNWALKGETLPSFYKDKVSYFAMGQNKWKSASNLSGITSDSIKLYLKPKKKLIEKNLGLLEVKINDKETIFKYSHDIFSTEDSLKIFSPGSSNDSDPFNNAFNRGLIFESAPFEKDVQLSGTISAHLYASLNVPDADIVLYYFEVDKQGNIKYLVNDKLRTRYRNSGTHPKLMIPHKPTLLKFENAFIKVQKINKGSKLKVYAMIANDMYNEKNYGFGGVVSKESAKSSRLIELSLYSDKKHTSYFSLPVQ